MNRPCIVRVPIDRPGQPTYEATFAGKGREYPDGTVYVVFDTGGAANFPLDRVTFAGPVEEDKDLRPPNLEVK